MSSVVERTDIDAFISSSVPEYLSVFRQFFAEYTDALLNGSSFSATLAKLPLYFNQFETSDLPPLLQYDTKLAAYSSYDIRNLVALSMVDDGPSFFTQFFAHFFERFELYYADRNENRYETLSGVLYTDDGQVTDSLIFTDEGIGEGCYALMAQVIFYMSERAAIAAQWADIYAMLTLMKPARLFVHQVPTLDFHINAIDPTDPAYDEDYASYFTVDFNALPSKLVTDVGLKTDGGGGLTTDYASLADYLATLTVVAVKYADAPTVTETLTGKVYIVEKVQSLYVAIEAAIEKEIVYLALSGASEIFHATVLTDLFIQGFSTTETMKIRFTWTVPKGTGLQ